MENPKNNTRISGSPGSRRGSRFPALPALLALLGLICSFCLSACGGPMPVNDPFFVAGSKSSLTRGNEYYLRGCHGEALKYFEDGLVAARLSDNVPLIVTGLNAIGAAKMAAGDYNGAAQSLEIALEESLNEETRPLLPTILGNLGSVAHKAGSRVDARELWERAATLALERGESPAIFLANLARDDYLNNSGEGFSLSFQRAFESLDHPDTDLFSRADILNLAGLDSLKKGDLSSSESYLQEALTLDRQNENQKGLAEDLEAFAALEKERGSFEKSAVYLGRAFYLRAALKEKKDMERIFKLLEEASKNGASSDLSSYRMILKSPELFDPLKALCP
jgi:tetratricopeptide (TPR) repeat protein